MNVLLDTNTFLWFSNNHKFLSPKAKSLIKDPANIIWLSMASVWEMAIKVSLGKLEGMSLPLAYFVDAQVRKNNFMLLEINIAHTGIVATLPLHHRDPFDRLIIAQSMAEGFPIITNDTRFDDYEIELYW